jgi:ABC-type transporter Mla subunit MlaD
MPDMVRLMQVQADLLSSLPETLSDLHQAVRSLSEVVEVTRQTMLSVQRVSERIDRVLDEVEDPVRGLRPGIDRLTQVLEDPVVERIPAALESIERTVLPIAAAADRARIQMARAQSLPARARARLRSSRQHRS